ncbi:MAG: cell wall metabolism sensor histidine kinase WalK, partial [Actinomycetota bacterium]|nr:cell wall metabolism sensor histidine kinase WalK [Actinomycetota bacterium]
YMTVNRVGVSAVLALAGAGSFRSHALDDFRGFLLITVGNISLGLLAGIAGAAHTWALAFGLPAMLALHFAFSGHVRARAERQKLADIVDSSSDGIVSVDRDGSVRSWNPASERITGYAAERVVGRAWADVRELLEARNEPEADEASSAYGDDRREARLLTIQSAEGETRWVAMSSAPLPEGGCAFVLRDETTRREIGEMLAAREREQMRADLIASVSHELRTPLTSILGFAQTLLARDADEDERARYLKIIEKEGIRLKKLIDDLLDLRDIAAGRVAANERVDLTELLAEQAELFRGESDAHRVVVDVPPQPLVVTGDRDRLSQVASNLISNAIKYSPEGGEVRVSAQAADGVVQMAVRDRGLGIPREHQQHIFTKFFRADMPEARRIGGTGLGLALSREIVEAHGGRISFESTEGEGSTFYVDLPAA